MRIERIEPIAVSLPLTEPMKMAGVEVRHADNVLVRLVTDDGIVGWGEAASAPTMTGELVPGIAAAVRYLAAGLQGATIESPAAALAAMDGLLYGNASAKSAIEMALYDVLGKARGVPVHALLGATRRSEVPALRMLSTGVTERDCAEAEQRKAEGFVAWKIKVGVNDPAYDAERTRTLCRLLGAGHLVSADANQGWSEAQALVYLQAVAGCGLDFLEQPIAAGDIDAMARLARATPIALGADEGLHAIEDIRRHHERGAIRGGSLKTIKLGGITRTLEAAQLAAELRLEVNLACKIAESNIGAAAVLHLAAAVPSVGWGVSLTNQYLAADVTDEPLVVTLGQVAVPTGPGLGVRVDDSLVRRYSVRL